MMTFEILTTIVLLNAVAIIELWRRAARRPEKPKKKFRDRLWWGKPITPNTSIRLPLRQVWVSETRSNSLVISKILRTSSIGT
jgi:hypothetical protein